MGANPTFLGAFHKNLEEIKGLPASDVLFPNPGQEDLQEKARSGGSLSPYLYSCIQEGKERRFLCWSVLREENGEKKGRIDACLEVTEALQEKGKRLEDLHVDSTTGLLTHWGMRVYLQAWERRFQEGRGKDFAYFAIHLGHMGEFEKAYGEETMNELFLTVGNVLKKAFGEEAIVGHVFGARFAVALPLESEKDEMAMEEKILACLTGIHRFGNEIPVTLFVHLGAERYSSTRDIDMMILLAESKLGPVRG